MAVETETAYVRWLDTLTAEDTPSVGGKNASLGEMIGSLKDQGVRVPGGFATTAKAYRSFMSANELDERLQIALEKLAGNEQSLEETGAAIRRMIRGGEFPRDIAQAIRQTYREMSERYDTDEVAVRGGRAVSAHSQR